MEKCIILSAKGEEAFNSYQISKLKEIANITFFKQAEEISDDELVNIIDQYEYVGITRRPIKDLNSEIFDRLTKLKGLAIFSTGYEWVDVKYARKKGIKISYLPEYSTTSVAEHTIGLLLSVLRRIHISYDYSRNIIDKNISMRGFELEGKKVGIIGFGRIGKKVYNMLQGFSVRVKCNDIDIEITKKNPELFETKDELIKTSDIIILCASKERGVEYIIGDLEIEKMKKGVIIINSAREDLVNNKSIFSYAVDEKVAFFNDNKIEIGRILQTGHTAWYSTEAIERGIEQWIENLVSMMKNKPINLAGDTNEQKSD